VLDGVDPSARCSRPPRVARRLQPSAAVSSGRAPRISLARRHFDRLFCVNRLHHFADRARFFAEARRVLKPGGGLLTIGKDRRRP
jgi:ubiquinone/menaquinone biosynthesis C-methylase UbiE